MRNRDWGVAKGLKLERGELVSGEHCGTKAAPQMPTDNPNFIAALRRANIERVGLDASLESDTRAVGPARSIPRYPMTLFFNTGTAVVTDAASTEIYTSRASGGSGACEAAGTCIAPISTTTGFQDKIIPAQVSFTLRSMTANNPRPYYIHQTNLAEDRLVYPMMDAILGAHRTAFAANTPVVNPSMSEAGKILIDQAAWRTATLNGSVTACVKGDELVVQSPNGIPVPITAPEGTDHSGLLAPEFGSRYAGERSATHHTGGTLRLELPRSWSS